MDLILTDKVNKKISYYINSIDEEIGGIAKGKIDKNGNIIVTDCILLKQTVNSAHIDFDEDYIVKFLYDLQKKGEKTEDWNVRWHSHANMGAFWSTDDENDIQTYSDQPYLISLVVNKKGEMKARLDIFPKDTSPFKIPMTFNKELDIIIEAPEDISLKNKCLKEVKKQVKIKKIKINTDFVSPHKSQCTQPKYSNAKWWEKKEEQEIMKELSTQEEFEQEGGYDTTDKIYDRKYNY